MSDKHRIRFKQELKNGFKRGFKPDFYNIVVEKPRDLPITIYLAELVFISSIKNEKIRTRKLIDLKRREGKITDYDKKKLEKIKVISITKIKEESEEEIEFNTER